MNLKKLFINYCKDNNYEINQNQIVLVEKLTGYYYDNFNKSFLKKFFKKKNKKLGFYLFC